MCDIHILSNFVTSIYSCEQGGICPPCFLIVWLREQFRSLPSDTYVHTIMAHGGFASGSAMATQPKFSREDLEELAKFAQAVGPRHTDVARSARLRPLGLSTAKKP
jgi:hypothetical protein